MGATREVKFRAAATTCWVLDDAAPHTPVRLQAGRDGAWFDIVGGDGTQKRGRLGSHGVGEFVLSPGDRIVLQPPRRPWNVHQLTVTRPATGPLRLTADRVAVRFGQAPILAVAMPAGATGHVGFLDEQLGWIGTAEIEHGKAVLPAPTRNLGPGTHRISAAYGGDERFLPADVNPIEITVRRAVPEIALAASGPILVARLPEEATGEVEFFDERQGRIGTAAIVAGVAELVATTKRLQTGEHRITASYSGDAIFRGATAGPLVVVVP